MISPYFIEGKLRFATKKGITKLTPVTEEFIEHSTYDYIRFSTEWIHNGYTPLFEMCSTKEPIVIKFTQDKLVLTALRHNRTGKYLPYNELVAAANSGNVPVVGLWKGLQDLSTKGILNVAQLMKEIEPQVDFEGCVLAFEDGRMYKLKTTWYSQVNKDRNLIASDKTSEKHMWRVVIEGRYDDIKPYLPSEDVDKLNTFYNEMTRSVAETAQRMKREVEDWRKHHGNNTKDFAVNFIPNVQHEVEKPLYFSIWRGNDPLEGMI
jgi:T4 RnlA family RNA ligase